jgi:hypothetical protein
LDHTEDSTPVLKIAYKIKMPEEISCLDVAHDGNHFAVGLAGGALIIKSKRQGADQEEEEELNEEEKLIKNTL